MQSLSDNNKAKRSLILLQQLKGRKKSPEHVEVEWYILRLTTREDFLVGVKNDRKIAKSTTLWGW